eukprot:3311549-Amphidinium_carterae.1
MATRFYPTCKFTLVQLGMQIRVLCLLRILLERLDGLRSSLISLESSSAWLRRKLRARSAIRMHVPVFMSRVCTKLLSNCTLWPQDGEDLDGLSAEDWRCSRASAAPAALNGRFQVLVVDSVQLVVPTSIDLG